MHGNFRRVIVNEVPDAVMRDTPKLSPLAERANRRLFACREDPAQAKAEDVRELILTG